MPNVILFPGAFMTRDCYKTFIETIERSGCHVHTIEYPRKKDATLLDYAVDAKRIVETNCGGDAILVCHSMGSRVAQMAGLMGVRGVIHVAGTVVQNGESYQGCINSWRDKQAPPDSEAARPVLSEDGAFLIPTLPFVKRAFFSDFTSCQCTETFSHMVPEIATNMTSPIYYTPPPFGTAPQLYITTLADAAIPIGLQHKMCEDQGITSIESVDAAHMPFVSCSAEVGEAVLRFIERLD
eukprot:TRINITY_DN9505_c0_g1_i2.p1 TRINITY_DN9505_c0_g1~~TRINITY_DN9505_c0_g1_i2.p1  ORF type:complete len:239 (+),score=38.61 TRINITY_DN9505_c0_g1_i2:49-765(+)